MISLNKIFVYRARLNKDINKLTSELRFNVKSEAIDEIADDPEFVDNYKSLNDGMTLAERYQKYITLQKYLVNINTAIAKANAEQASEYIAKIDYLKNVLMYATNISGPQKSFKSTEKRYIPSKWDRSVNPPIQGMDVIYKNVSPDTVTDYSAEVKRLQKEIIKVEDALAETNNATDVSKYLEKEVVDYLTENY